MNQDSRLVNSRTIILLRGLPGSGKSTLALLLSESQKYPVFSIDDYFTDSEGKYHFNHLENHLAYEQCRKQTEEAMRTNTTKIFVDNTFTIDWEMQPYFELAKKYDYRIFVVTVENYHNSGNIHGIPEDQISKMREKYRVKP